jgi:Uma2 family endonuclease
MEPAYKLLTVEEFLDCSPNDQRHYQLIGGVIVAMAPPGNAHQILLMNLGFELGGAVRANRPGCTLHGEAGIAPHGLQGRDHFEADIAFTCAAGDAQSRGIVSEPELIIEILSPSTERDDLFVKLPVYQRIPSVREVLYLESQEVAATVYRRQADGWDTIKIAGPGTRLELYTIGLDIPLGEVYRGVPGLSGV